MSSATDDTDKVIPASTWAIWYAHPCTKRLIAKLQRETDERLAFAWRSRHRAAELFAQGQDDAAASVRRDADEFFANVSAMETWLRAIKKEAGVDEPAKGKRTVVRCAPDAVARVRETFPDAEVIVEDDRASGNFLVDL